MPPVQSEHVKRQIQQRLSRIEGQVRGVQKMLDDERECREILQQFNAILAAVQTTTDLFVRTYAKECLLNIEATEVRDREAMIDQLLDLMVKARPSG
ncbi:MAG: metal-sensitive transcriptional regulator [Caldilineaceae bacterium]|nr:metal-sensitive transcriptional regulator [Caldilineaceae bacterium]